MKDKVETIIQGKRYVARAVQQPDNKVAFHIYDFPDINGLPESRITQLAKEFGLENSKNFIWYGRDHFEKLYGQQQQARTGMSGRSVITELTQNTSPYEHHIPFARISHILGDHFRGVNPLEDDVLKQIIEHTQQHVERRGKEVAHQGHSMSINEQRYLLSILRSVLPALIPVPAEEK